MFPHIGYEFKNRPDFDVRTELITHAMTSAGVLNRLQTGCSLHNDFLRTEYAHPSMEEENSGVIISSQICSNLSQRYRVDRAYADSVEDDSYLFDRGFPYINSHIIRLDGVDGYKGDVKPVYVRFHDELYRNHETMALFWAALLGSFIISLSFDCLIWLSSRLAACFVAIHELWLDCGATFYEHVKNKKF